LGGKIPLPPKKEKEAWNKRGLPHLSLLRFVLSSKLNGIGLTLTNPPSYNNKSWCWTQAQKRVTVLGKLFTPIIPLFIKQRKW